MTAADDAKNRNAPKPGHKHLNIPNVPEPDLIALEHAATDARQTRAELVRALLHTAAEQQRGRGESALMAYGQRRKFDDLPGPATGYKFEFTVTGIDAAKADQLQSTFVAYAEFVMGQVGGGYHQVDDNGNPAH